MIGLIKKLTINVELLDNFEFLPYLYNLTTKYSQSQVVRGKSVSYFQHGHKLMYASDFVEKYKRVSNYKPTGDFVVLISVSSNLATNDKNIIRFSGGTFLVFSADVTSIRHLNEYYKNPGLAFNPNLLSLKGMTHKMGDRSIELKAWADQDIQFTTSPAYHVLTLERILDPVVTTALDLTRTLNVQHFYKDEETSDALVNVMKKIFLMFELFDPKAAAFRQKLTALLQANSLEEANAAIGFIVDGVSFNNQNEYKYYLQMYGHEGGVAERKRELRAMSFYMYTDLVKLAHEMTEEEFARHPDAMMLEEERQMYLSPSAENKEYKQTILDRARRRYREGRDKPLPV